MRAGSLVLFATIVVVATPFCGTLSAQTVDMTPSSATSADTMKSTAPTAAALLARADSLFESGHRGEALDAYLAVLAVDPSNSRAVFRLAQLAPAGSDESGELYVLYTELEPDDEWGWIALAEDRTDAGELADAVAAYDAALVVAPGERDAVIGRAHVLMLGDLAGDAAASLTDWVADHDGDLEAWRMLARALREIGDTERELDALERVAALDPLDPSLERRDALRARNAMALQPTIGGSIDSDGSAVTRVGLSADVALTSRSRIGIQLERATADDGDGVQSADRGLLYYSLRGDDAFRLDARAGVAMRENASGRASNAFSPIGRVRARFGGDAERIGLELRLQRSLQDATSTLIENGTILEEALVALEIPTSESLRLRLLGAGGAIVDGSKRNWRVRAAGGPELIVAPGVRIGAQYDGTMYTGRGKGYFAPSLAQTIEATASAELEELGDFSLAVEAGAGVQQVIEDKGGVGAIAPSLRGWGSLAWSFAPSSSLALELEAYNLAGGASVAGGSTGWSYGSATITLRWAL